MAWHRRLLDEVPAWSRTRDEVEERMTGLMAAIGGSK
jgi:hypothetical protein